MNLARVQFLSRSIWQQPTAGRETFPVQFVSVDSGEGQILERLGKLVAQVVGSEDVALHRDTVAEDVPGWNSITHLQIISTVEADFAVKLGLREVLRIENVGDLVDVLKAKSSP